MTQYGKLGLVLSGGGAKGAYQVGILKYMSEMGMQPDMVSGTSIGALNAAVVCAKKDIGSAAAVLEEIWNELANTSPVKMDGKKLVSSASLILNLIPAARLNPIVLGVRAALQGKKVLQESTDVFRDLYAHFSEEYQNSDGYKASLEGRDQGILLSEPLVDLLTNHASKEQLKAGMPFYIGVYESEGSFRDIAHYFSQTVLGNEARESVFWHVQSLEDKNIHDAIMASAALPFLFQARSVSGKKYRDGGMGDAFNQQGNTPIQPLVDNGCSHVVVSLLDDGSTFDRHRYPGTAIIEVRPKEFISTSMTDMLAFKPEKISEWMEQGYNDARRCIGNVQSAAQGIELNKRTRDIRDSVVNQLDNDGFNITP